MISASFFVVSVSFQLTSGCAWKWLKYASICGLIPMMLFPFYDACHCRELLELHFVDVDAESRFVCQMDIRQLEVQVADFFCEQERPGQFRRFDVAAGHDGVVAGCRADRRFHHRTDLRDDASRFSRF